MPSSFTTRNRLTLQATGENINLWGQILNSGVFEQIDKAMDGVTTISASGPTTLTTANGADDQARSRVLNVTAPGPAQITIPSVEKFYIVRAAVADVTITNGTASLIIRSGDCMGVVTDGVAIWPVRSTDFNGQRLRRIGAPQASDDAATRKYVDDAALAGQANLPVGTGNRVRYLRVKADESGPEWEPDEIYLTAGYTASVGDRLVCDTSGGSFTVTLPAAPQDGDWIALRDGSNGASGPGWAENGLLLDPNGSTINGEAVVNCNLKGAAITLRFLNGGWSVKLG